MVRLLISWKANSRRFSLTIKRGGVANGLDQFTSGMLTNLLNHGGTGQAIIGVDFHLDQFVMSQGVFDLQYDVLGQASAADDHNGFSAV